MVKRGTPQLIFRGGQLIDIKKLETVPHWCSNCGKTTQWEFELRTPNGEGHFARRPIKCIICGYKKRN